MSCRWTLNHQCRVADFKDVVYGPPSFISAKWTIPSSTALPGYLQEVAAKHFETLQLTLRSWNWFFPLKDMGRRLENRSWGNVKDPSTEIVAWSRNLSPIQWFVFSNLHRFFCRLVNLTLRPCFSRVLGRESPSKREIQGVGTSYKVILWPGIFQSVMLRGLDPPSQHRQNGTEAGNTPMTQWHSDAGVPLSIESPKSRAYQPRKSKSRSLRAISFSQLST